jgi:hypothetical protein
MGRGVTLEAVRLLFHGEVRHRWRSWLALAALIALVGGLVLAAAAAGRRTASAFPRFVADHGFDAGVFNAAPLPALSKLPEVASAIDAPNWPTGQPTCACTRPINSNLNFSVTEVAPSALPRMVKLVAGRMPSQSAPDEALASFTLEQDNGVHVGTVIHIPFYQPSQAPAVFNPTGTPVVPTGPTLALRVVGVEAAEGEFPSGGTQTYDLWTTQAFARTTDPRTLVFQSYFVRLRHGAADLPRFESDATALGVLNTFNQDGPAASVSGSIHPQAVGWWVLAVLAALAGLAVIAQALSRQSVVESDEFPTMTALGVAPGQLTALGMARTMVVALAGAVGAVGLAFVLSPLTPVGEARLAEPNTGFAFDPFVLLLGALAIVAVVVLLGVWPAIRAARVRRVDDRAPEARPSVLVARLAAAGAPPSAVVGVRHALERGRGRATVPVGTALLGTIVAVMALVGTAVFGASLSHLTATPALYGDDYQIFFSGFGPSAQQENTTFLDSLKHDRAIDRIMIGFPTEVSIKRISVLTLAVSAVQGPILVSTIDGRFPSSDDQIALGATTMRQLGTRIGSLVPVTVPLPGGGRRTVGFRVVARVSFPGDVGSGGLGTGAALTIAGYEHAVCPASPAQSACQSALNHNLSYAILASAVPGGKGHAAITHYLDVYQFSARGPVTPTSLVNFGESVNFPLILGVMLGLFGAATLVHLLVVSVARRRREVGLLKALGFVSSQVGAAVCWQATAVVATGIVIGVPLGIFVGGAVWKAFASNLGVVPVTVVQVWLLAALVVGVLVVANLLAVAPALAAIRSKPSQLLRTQ